LIEVIVCNKESCVLNTSVDIISRVTAILACTVSCSVRILRLAHWFLVFVISKSLFLAASIATSVTHVTVNKLLLRELKKISRFVTLGTLHSCNSGESPA